jgi:hypothetical protein
MNVPLTWLTWKYGKDFNEVKVTESVLISFRSCTAENKYKESFAVMLFMVAESGLL